MSKPYSADIEEDLDSDLVLLEEINEKTATEKLQERYKQEKIYTYIGPVLIAVNPYKLIKKDGISIYDTAVANAYNHRTIHEVQPHPFAIAEVRCP